MILINIKTTSQLYSVYPSSSSSPPAPSFSSLSSPFSPAFFFLSPPPFPNPTTLIPFKPSSCVSPPTHTFSLYQTVKSRPTLSADGTIFFDGRTSLTQVTP
ncbi:hypothetical protein Dimus_019398 [Dionaea muscipula]